MGKLARVYLEEHAVALLDELFDGVYILDRDRTILFWNTGAERITGYHRDQIIGIQCPEGPLKHENDLGCRLCEHQCPAMQVMESGEAGTAVVFATCADGQKLPVETHIRPLKNPVGQVVGAIEVFRDVSQWKNVERLSGEKDQLLGILAHDIRNPLTIIQAYAMLLDRITPQQMSDIAPVLVRKTKYALALVDNLLNAKAIESGTVTLNLQDLDLEAAVRDALSNFTANAADRKVTLQLHASAPGIRLQMDPVRFEEIVNNLISNALKYSPPGSRVEVALAEGPESITLKVSDQGIGIKPEDLARLFQPFGRTSNRPLDGEKSHGLGLYIVKKIVDLFHGSVTVDSAPNQGTIFTVTFPRS
jgi:PAS domain S-box-containing protein